MRLFVGHTLLDSLVESSRTTAMLFAILTGALMFAEFVNYTSMPEDLKNLVTSFNLSPIMVMAAICAIYVILGTLTARESPLCPGSDQIPHRSEVAG